MPHDTAMTIHKVASSPLQRGPGNGSCRIFSLPSRKLNLLLSECILVFLALLKTFCCSESRFVPFSTFLAMMGLAGITQNVPKATFSKFYCTQNQMVLPNKNRGLRRFQNSEQVPVQHKYRLNDKKFWKRSVLSEENSLYTELELSKKNVDM